MKAPSEKPGTLFIVGTPIGNLKDITLRALEILKTVDLIAAEDTRQTQKLLHHFHFSTPLTSYHDYNKEEKAEVLIVRLKEGMNVALVTDAGTPGISDPGYYLIRRANEEKITVSPVPGPSAVIAALSVSGLPLDAFIFEGFLPSRKVARQKHLKSLASEKRTLIFFESPHRLKNALQDVEDFLGDRPMTLTRELTKVHEEVLRGTVSEILRSLEGKRVRGEITLVIGGCRGGNRGGDEGGGHQTQSLSSPASFIPDLTQLLTSGLKVKEAAAQVAREHGIPKKIAYAEALKLRKKQ